MKHNDEGCKDLGWTRTHEYSSEVCPECSAVFCWNCCDGTNLHEGGKYEATFMNCPVCGHNIYQEDE